MYLSGAYWFVRRVVAAKGLLKEVVVAVSPYSSSTLCALRRREKRRRLSRDRSRSRAGREKHLFSLVVRDEEGDGWMDGWMEEGRELVIIRTQHSHESVSKDRMAHTWRALSVGRAIFPRSQTNAIGCIVALTEHQLRGCE